MAGIADQKAAARKAGYARRKAAHETGHDLTDALLGAIAPLPGNIVAGYWPIRTEADPRHALTSLSKDRRIVLPVVDGDGLPLSFRFWWPDAQMIAGAFGAEIPEDEGGAEPDIVIVPLVAFDNRGFRLGYGGGFYDRTLERIRATKRVTAIGLAYSAQEIDQLPVEPTDQPLDMIVTENGVRRFDGPASSLSMFRNTSGGAGGWPPA